MEEHDQIFVGKHNDRQQAFPHHEVATDVKQMPIRPKYSSYMKLWVLLENRSY